MFDGSTVETLHHTGFDLRNSLETKPDLIERLRPSVATIYGSKMVYDNDPDTGMPRSRKARISVGSGFFIDERHIVTNRHVVVDQDSEFTVALSGGKVVKAKVAYIDTTPDALRDLAVVEIEPEAHTSRVVLGDSDMVRQGEEVITIGTPLNVRGSVSSGIISRSPLKPQISDNANESLFKRFIATDADIHPGNSGGPLFNARGELIGINTANLPDEENGSGAIGLAIPINEARALIENVDSFVAINQVFEDVRTRREEEDLRLDAAVADVIQKIGNILVKIPEEIREKSVRQILSDPGILFMFASLIGKARSKRDQYLKDFEGAFGAALGI
jgi:S1-C subfamily serine protease